MAQSTEARKIAEKLIQSQPCTSREIAEKLLGRRSKTKRLTSPEISSISGNDSDSDNDETVISKRLKSLASLNGEAVSAGRESLSDSQFSEPSVERKSTPPRQPDSKTKYTLSSSVKNDVSVNKIFKTSRTILPDGEILKALKDAERGKLKDYIMCYAPVFPSGGDIILYQCKNNTDTDYLFDKYTGLRNNGRSCGKDTKVHRTYYALKDKSNCVIPGFKKTVFWLAKSIQKDDRVVLIHYEGDESVWTPRCHGNSKDSTRSLTHNTNATKEKIKEVSRVTEAKPAKVYQKVIKDASKEEFFEDRQAVITPRDKKQVENQQYRLKLQGRVHDDEMLAIYTLGRYKVLGNFIRGFRLLTCEAIVVSEDSAIELANSLMKEAKNISRPVPLCFGLDTTFNLGDCFVTPMIMRNIFLEGEPIFPVAYLLHETKEAEAHQFFFSTMSKFLPLNDLPIWCPFVTDREGGILKAARLELKHPGICKDTEASKTAPATNCVINYAGDDFHHVLCSLHITRDVKWWIKNHKGKREDEAVLLSEVESLLDSKSLEEFHELFSQYEQKWTQSFKDYMRGLITDFKRSARFYTQQFPCFTEFSATTNFVESFNSILKNQNDWTNLRYECVLLNLFNTQLCYMNEFHRSFQAGGIGNFRPKPSYAKSGCRFKLPAYAYWEPEDFVKKFKKDHPPDTQKFDIHPVHGDRALARLACDLGYVSLNPQVITYTVTGPYDLSRHVVQEDDSGQLLCSCPKPGLCLHREAYLRVTKKTLEEGKTKWRLSEIRRNTRGFKGPTGRKPKKKIDDADVVPAPDSDLAKERARLEISDDDSIAEVLDHNEIRAESFDKNDRPAKDILPFRAKSPTLTTTDSHEEDGMDEDDYNHDAMGLHHYSRLAFILENDGNKSTRSSLSGLSEGPTPEYFKIPVTEVQLKPEIYRGRLETLRPNSQLSTKVVDNLIALLIKVHGLEEKVALASTMTFSFALQVESFDCAGHLLSWAKRSEAINSDLLLVSMMSLDPNHFFLGVVIWSKHIVVIMNSLEGFPSAMEPYYTAVLKIIHASHLVAGAAFQADSWTFHEETEGPIQTDGTSCGIWSIVNAYCICSKRRLFTVNDQPDVNHLRRWAAKCLSHRDAKGDCILLREGDPVRHLRRSEKMELSDKLRSFGPYLPQIVRSSAWRLARDELRGACPKEAKCNALHCTDDIARRSLVKIKCVNCHYKFHSGICVPLSNTQCKFYICPTCSPNDDEGDDDD